MKWSLLLVAACAGHAGGGAGADGGVDGGADAGADASTAGAADAAVDAGSGSGSDPGMPATLVVAASNGDVTNAFSLAATGTAGAPYGGVSLARDVGMIDLGGGAVHGFVYATVNEGAYTLYDGFAVSPTSWDAFYLYCENGALADVYDEKVGGHGMVYAAVTGGHCSASAVQTVAQVSLPAFSIAAPAPVGGYTVSGNGIDVAADGTGTLDIGATRMPLVVFDDVDCSACGGAGWYELHSIVWDAAQQRAVFVIVYLINGSATSVELAYARSLPDLGDPIGTRVVNASWTAAHVRSKPRAVRGVPPPLLTPGS